MNNYIQETYTDCDERVKTFLSRVFEDCLAKNETLTNYFYCTLDLLKNQLVLYYMSVDAIEDAKKISSEDAYRRMAKHPAVAIMAKAHSQILDILEKLGLSPFSAAKIKRLNNDSDAESAEALLQNLIN